jgi:hypothetical protein
MFGQEQLDRYIAAAPANNIAAAAGSSILSIIQGQEINGIPVVVPGADLFSPPTFLSVDITIVTFQSMPDRAGMIYYRVDEVRIDQEKTNEVDRAEAVSVGIAAAALFLLAFPEFAPVAIPAFGF